MSRSVFVAGATGVLGRRVIPALVAAGHDVTANVRDDDARRGAEQSGARAVTVDLFDRAATVRLADDHDAVINIATAIPAGSSGARRSGWALNDRLRSEASAGRAAAMFHRGGRYVGESITSPTSTPARSGSTRLLTAPTSGAIGPAWTPKPPCFADDSAHVTMIRWFAARGLFFAPGRADGRISFVHVDDAAERSQPRWVVAESVTCPARWRVSGVLA